jgi:hypothetical protein
MIGPARATARQMTYSNTISFIGDRAKSLTYRRGKRISAIVADNAEYVTGAAVMLDARLSVYVAVGVWSDASTIKDRSNSCRIASGRDGIADCPRRQLSIASKSCRCNRTCTGLPCGAGIMVACMLASIIEAINRCQAALASCAVSRTSAFLRNLLAS